MTINAEIRAAAAAPAASKSDILLSSNIIVDEDVTSSPVDMTSSTLRTVETCGVQVTSGGITQTHESSLVK